MTSDYDVYEYTPSPSSSPDSTFEQNLYLPDHNVTRSDSYYLGDRENTAIIITTLVLCGVTVLLNLLVMSHYRSRAGQIYDNMVPFIYFVLGLSDFATGVCAGLHTILFSLIMGLKGRDLTPSVLWIITPAYFLSVVAFKVSAFVSMTFAVIRTINIASLFYQVNRKAAIASIIVWLSFWVLVSIVEMGLSGHQLRNLPVDDLVKNVLIAYFYQPNKPKLFQSIQTLYLPGNHEGKVRRKMDCVVELLYTALPVFLCAAICLVATVIQVAILIFGGTVSGKVGSDDDLKRRVGVTVVMIGTVFIVCSSCTLYQPLQLCAQGYGDNLSTLYFLGYFPFFLNSALNPLILVARVSQLRDSLWRCLSCSKDPAPGSIRDTSRRSLNGTSSIELQSWSFSTAGFREMLRSISRQSSK